MIGRADIDHIIADNRSAGNRTLGCKFPTKPAGAVLDTIQVSIRGTTIKGIFINDRRTTYLVIRFESPNFPGIRAFDTINKTIRRANKNQVGS